MRALKAGHNSGVERSNEPSVSDRGDERSESERREDPMSERRDDRSESEISSGERIDSGTERKRLLQEDNEAGGYAKGNCNSSRLQEREDDT